MLRDDLQKLKRKSNIRKTRKVAACRWHAFNNDRSETEMADMCKVMEDMRNEAVEKDRIQNAIEMLKDGLSVEKAAQYSHLAVERVRELAMARTAR